MKPVIAFTIGLALGIGLCGAFARAEVPKPQPKPELVNLHCRSLYGGPDQLELWRATGGQFEAVLGRCGSMMPKASCEAAAAAVNDFRPVIENEGPTGWKLFFAMCAGSQPQTMI